MLAHRALLFNIFLTCAALRVENGLHNLEAPTCVMTQTGPVVSVPPFKDAPTSWEHAISQSVHADQDCYNVHASARVDPANALINNGTCCCGFWAAPTALTETSMADARHDTCTVSYPVFGTENPQHEFAECADVAIAISGSLKFFPQNESLFDNIERIFIRPAVQAKLSVHVFMHLGSKHIGTNISSVPSFVKKIIVEKTSDPRIGNTINDCTRGMVTELFTELGHRSKPYGGLRDHAQTSMGPMHRRIFLAHHMVRTTENDLKCKYKYILRIRPDLSGSPFDWHPVLERLKQGTLLVGESRLLFDMRSSAVSHRHRCAVDDQIAIGTPEQMYAYASVYPDFSDFAKYLPLHRADFRGHTNERTMAAHLHYRGLGDAFTTFPHDLNIDRKLGR